MASTIDTTKPIEGNPTTLSVRTNFASAKSEIEALQAADVVLTDDLADEVVARTNLGDVVAAQDVDITANTAAIATKAPLASPAFTGTVTIDAEPVQIVQSCVVDGDGNIVTSTGGTWSVSGYTLDGTTAYLTVNFPTTAASAASQTVIGSWAVDQDPSVANIYSNSSTPIRELTTSSVTATISNMILDVPDISKTTLHIMRIVTS